MEKQQIAQLTAATKNKSNEYYDNNLKWISLNFFP